MGTPLIKLWTTFTETSIVNTKSEVDSYIDVIFDAARVGEIFFRVVLYVTASNDTIDHTFRFVSRLYDTTRALVKAETVPSNPNLA